MCNLCFDGGYEREQEGGLYVWEEVRLLQENVLVILLKTNYKVFVDQLFYRAHPLPTTVNHHIFIKGVTEGEKKHPRSDLFTDKGIYPTPPASIIFKETKWKRAAQGKRQTCSCISQLNGAGGQNQQSKSSQSYHIDYFICRTGLRWGRREDTKMKSL